MNNHGYEIPFEVESNPQIYFISSGCLSRVERFLLWGNPTSNGATDRLNSRFIPLSSFLKNRANDNISLKREEGQWHDTCLRPYLNAAVIPPTEYTSPKRLFVFCFNGIFNKECHIGGVCLND